AIDSGYTLLESGIYPGAEKNITTSYSYAKLRFISEDSFSDFSEVIKLDAYTEPDEDEDEDDEEEPPIPADAVPLTLSGTGITNNGNIWTASGSGRVFSIKKYIPVGGEISLLVTANTQAKIGVVYYNQSGISINGARVNHILHENETSLGD